MRTGPLAAAALLAACAGASTPPAGSWIHPSFGPGQLEGDVVVVLPIGAVALPEGAPDSLAGALALRAGEALATALQAGGAARMAIRPSEAIAELASLSATDVAALYAPLTAAILDPARGGEIPPDAASRWRGAAERTEGRYFLVPRSLSIERLEPLRVRAGLDAWLVDAPAARILWHAPLSAVNPHAPSGAAADVYAAALEDAIEAVAGTLATRLARLARTGSDDLEAATP